MGEAPRSQDGGDYLEMGSRAALTPPCINPSPIALVEVLPAWGPSPSCLGACVVLRVTPGESPFHAGPALQASPPLSGPRRWDQRMLRRAMS